MSESGARDPSPFFLFSPDPMCEAGTDGCFKTVNPAFCRALGYSEAELLSRPYSSFVHPDDRSKTYTEAAAVRDGNPTLLFENRYICKNGDVKWLSWRSTTKGERIYAIARDVTEERLAHESKLKASATEAKIEAKIEAERQFREIFDNVGIGLALSSYDGEMSLVNRELHSMLGYAPGELTGASFLDLTSPDDTPTPDDQRQGLREGRLDKIVRERELMRKDGSRVWVLQVMSVVRHPNGAPKYFVLAHKDITLRRTMESSLRRALKDLSDLKTALDQSAIVAVTDPSGRITDVNDGFCRISKYDRDELVGHTHAIVNSGYHTREFFSGLWKTISSGRIWRGEIQNRAKDGTLYWVDTCIVPSLDSQGHPFRYTAIRNDITEKKRNEAERTELRAREQAALEASRFKSEFLANMSHEIRTPLNGVTGMAKLLLDTRLSAEQKDFAETIVYSADSLLAIVNDILDLSKIEAGKLEIERVDFELGELIESSVRVMRFSAREKGIGLSVDVDKRLERMLHGDPVRIKQIVFNLVQNAVKFTTRGQVGVRIRRVGEGSGHSQGIRIEVEDTGIGISEAAQRRIFGAFVQGDASTTRKYGGTGLGLSICKRLTDLMGGSIGLSSHPGSGSTFWVEIPVTLAKEKPRLLPKTAKRRSPSVPAAAGRDILVVDDNTINQKVIRRILENIGHRVTLVGSGEESLERLRKRGFDLIIMDCHMPGMDGYETTHRIRKLKDPVKRKVPILALTADVLRGTRERCLAAGMTDYVRKPVDALELERTISKNIRPKSQTPSHARRRAKTVALIDSEAIDRLRKMNSPGQPDIVAELASDFVRKAPAVLRAILTAIGSGDRETLEREAHTLKSTSALLGAAELSELCKTIEAQARLLPASKATELARRLGKLMEPVVERMAELAYAGETA